MGQYVRFLREICPLKKWPLFSCAINGAIAWKLLTNKQSETTTRTACCLSNYTHLPVISCLGEGLYIQASLGELEIRQKSHILLLLLMLWYPTLEGVELPCTSCTAPVTSYTGINCEWVNHHVSILLCFYTRICHQLKTMCLQFFLVTTKYPTTTTWQTVSYYYIIILLVLGPSICKCNLVLPTPYHRWFQDGIQIHGNHQLIIQ
jgi:hypothetical protein